MSTHNTSELTTEDYAYIDQLQSWVGSSLNFEARGISPRAEDVVYVQSVPGAWREISNRFMTLGELLKVIEDSNVCFLGGALGLKESLGRCEKMKDYMSASDAERLMTYFRVSRKVTDLAALEKAAEQEDYNKPYWY